MAQLVSELTFVLCANIQHDNIFLQTHARGVWDDKEFLATAKISGFFLQKFFLHCYQLGNIEP